MASHRFPLKDLRPLGGAVALNRAPQAPAAPAPAPNSLEPELERFQRELGEPLRGSLRPVRTSARVQDDNTPVVPLHAPGPSEMPEETSSAAARVRLLERLLRTQEAELCRKDREIQRLEEAYKEMEFENREIHRFLADYGMEWVGATAEMRGHASSSKAQEPSKTVPNQLPSSPDLRSLDMEAVRRSVAELNAMAGTGCGEVVRRRDGSHGFELSPPTLTLTFWRDGLQIDCGAIREYSEPSTVAFFRDLLDGFFPYELKDSYPEGVLFSVSDKRHLHPGGASAQLHDWGTGRRLDSRRSSRPGSARSERSCITSESRLPSQGVWLPSASDPAKGPSAALHDHGRAFAPVLADGRPPPAAAVPVDSRRTESDNAVSSACRLGSATSSSRRNELTEARSGEVSRVRIKGASGAVALVTELAVETTLDEVCELLQARGVVKAGQGYTLRTAFPARVLTDRSLTLAAAGLTPSATLLVTIESSRTAL